MHRLLLIEPSETIAAPICALLEQNAFIVDRITTPAEARTLDLSSFAVLVVHVASDDLRFVQWLHQHHSHLVGRIVVTAAEDHDALALELDRLGVCDVVPKPINAQEILRAVFDCLEKSPEFSVQ